MGSNPFSNAKQQPFETLNTHLLGFAGLVDRRVHGDTMRSQRHQGEPAPDVGGTGCSL